MTNFVEKLFSCLKHSKNSESESVVERGSNEAPVIGTNEFDVHAERLKKQVPKADPAAKSIRSRPSSTHIKLQALSASGVGSLTGFGEEAQSSSHLTGFLDKLEA